MPTLPTLRAAALAARLAAAGLLALAGCKLIDQRTFAPAPDASTTAPDKREPLITVQPGTALPTYANVLASAVRQAEARDPAVQFDVIALVPRQGGLAEQVRAADSGRAGSVEVARALMAAGVDAGRIHLGARPDPGARTPQVRVYLR